MAGHSALFLHEVWVAFLGWNLDEERNQQHPAAHRLVDVVEPGLVVADDPQLESGSEIKIVAAHEPGGHFIAAGHGLDFDFVPTATLLGFLGNDQSIAVQLGDIGRVSLGGGCDECSNIGDGCIVATDRGDRVNKRRLAVGAGTVGEHEFLLGGSAGHAIADEALQE
jgi:hypothetical protein